MTKYQVYRLASTSCLAILLLLGGCNSVMKETVNLDPNDPRPILSVQVADADEAELLVKQLELEVVRVESDTVYFFEDASRLPRLAELGYELKKQNPHDVFRRVVRIDRSVAESQLNAMGVRVINREERFLIVEATIGQLRALVRGGSQIVAVSGHEPRPRQIRIVVSSTEDVRKIGAMAVDIYSAKPEPREKPDPDQTYREVKIVIYGGAFDYQIDQLKNAGYGVEILPEPAAIRGGK